MFVIGALYTRKSNKEAHSRKFNKSMSPLHFLSQKKTCHHPFLNILGKRDETKIITLSPLPIILEKQNALFITHNSPGEKRML